MAKAKPKSTRNRPAARLQIDDDPARYVISDYDPIERFEREPGGRLYKPPAAVPPPSKEANRTLRRRTSKYLWNEICAEIAAQCIDPTTRQLVVPKSENKLAEKILKWLETNSKPAPVESEMREAVKAICARLRKI